MTHDDTMNTVIDILEWMSVNGETARLVLSYLNEGMWEEWDCDLEIASELFGDQEFKIAAQCGLSLATYHQRIAEERDE
jgi:hypothetical protein